MKRCKDCIWIRSSQHNDYDGRIFRTCAMKHYNPTHWFNEAGNCGQYRRKRRLWFAWWVPKVLLITLALLIGGCVHVKQDGFEYWRFGSQQIGSALLTLPDGSELLLDGQKSELPTVEITATSITIGGKEVKP